MAACIGDTVHIIDLAFVIKGGEGNTAFLEVDDSGVAAAYAEVGEGQLGMLSDEGLPGIAEQLNPNTSALVIVWENAWAARVPYAMRAAHGTLAGMIRVPHEVVASALQDLEGEE